MLSNETYKMENFNLQWPFHATTSSTLLVNMLRDQEMTDITLVSGDMKEVTAHKVVLCSVSPVLRKLIKSKSEHNFCLYLGETKIEELQALLNFIYIGAVE